LTPGNDPDFDEKVADVCQVYRDAPERHEQGGRTLSTDELTGVQALEAIHPGLPMAPGKVERREFEYTRHGTLAFILSRDVATGEVIAPYAGPTRTEADFLAHVQAVVATDPTATCWHFVCDNLNTHQSESLVRYSRFAAKPGCLPHRPNPSHRLSLHTQALLLAKPNRNLAEHSHPQTTQACLIPLA
jgi:hypothetical protein